MFDRVWVGRPSPTSTNSMKKSYDFSRGKRGPAIPNRGTVLITIDLDDATFEYFKVESERTGKCYQALINEALAECLSRVERRPKATGVRDVAGEEFSRDVERPRSLHDRTSEDSNR